MIVIDTNIISDLWKAEPNPNVLAWIDAQAIGTLYLSAVTVTELRHGLMVATRDTSPFEAGGPEVINPWVARQ